MVGWDDVRCRPITYREKSNENGSTSLLGDSRKDEAICAARAPPDTARGNAGLNCGKAKKHLQDPFRRIPSYGGSRKHLRPDEDKDDNCRFEAASIPMFRESSIVQGSFTVKKKPESNNPENADNKAQAMLPHPGLPGQDHHCSVFELRDAKPVEVDTECLTPSKGSIQSVSSMTSLSNAKEFFRKLDTEHNLNISTEPSTSPIHKRKPAGRSCRSRRVLTKEYSEYTAACDASSVTPLSKAAYAANRLHFRSDFYDGFFDDGLLEG